MNEKALESLNNFITLLGEYEIAEEGTTLEAWKVYVSSDYKALRKKFKMASKLCKEKNYDEAEKTINECLKLINSLKKRVDEIPDGSKLSTILSYINPLLAFVNSSEFDGFGSDLIYTAGGLHTATTVKEKVYEDEMSKTSVNAMKKEVQRALNLFAVKCQRIQKNIHNLRLKDKKKA